MARYEAEDANSNISQRLRFASRQAAVLVARAEHGPLFLQGRTFVPALIATTVT